MDSQNQPIEKDNDVFQLINKGYRGVEMDATFRLTLLAKTRRVVAAAAGGNPGGIRSRRWAFGLATGAELVLAGLALWYFALAPKIQVAPSGAVANRATISSAAPVAGTPTAPINKTAPAVAIGEKQNPVGQSATLTAPAINNRMLVAIIAAGPPVRDGKGRALKVGDRLPAGAVITTGKNGRATMITRQGSEFTVDAGTTLAFSPSGQSAELQKGRLYFHNRQREFIALNTAAGKIELLGTIVDAAVKDENTVAVTVVEGKVRLANSRGAALVESGNKSLLIAQLPPTAGAPVNTTAETAWYDRRNNVISDFGDIAYTVPRKDFLATEVWEMKADGSNKHRIKSYLGYSTGPSFWLPGGSDLLVKIGSVIWSTPDFKKRIADGRAGHPIVKDRDWVLNSVSGQDRWFQLPKGYDPIYTILSPDGRQLAFCGYYQPDPDNDNNVEGGVWVFDLGSGKIKKLLEGWIKNAPTWDPDSRQLAVSTGEDYTAEHHLVIVDSVSGAVTNLKIPGAGASFSPDGSSIAYCGDFQKSGGWYDGIPTSGSIFVLDLRAKDREPRRISPVGEGDLLPSWSPDGGRLVYFSYQSKWKKERNYPGYTIFVAAADGSSIKKIYAKKPDRETGNLKMVGWAPDGKNIYAITAEGILLLDAGGGGLIANLGGTAKDSILPPAEKAQTEGALSALREAVFQYATGKVRAYEGKPAESQAAFKVAAGIFSGLLMRFPLSGFSSGNLLDYADEANKSANLPASTILRESCKERMLYLGSLFAQYVGTKDGCPADLKTLEAWGGTNWISGHDTALVKMLFRCPKGDSFQYKAPPAGTLPHIGDMLVTCPNHPESRMVWDKMMIQKAQWQKEIAAKKQKS
jgi:Tol biopolymer transport system component